MYADPQEADHAEGRAEAEDHGSHVDHQDDHKDVAVRDVLVHEVGHVYHIQRVNMAAPRESDLAQVGSLISQQPRTLPDHV